MKIVTLDGEEHRAGSLDCCPAQLICRKPAQYGPRGRCGGRIHRQRSWTGAIDLCEICVEGWQVRFDSNGTDGVYDALIAETGERIWQDTLIRYPPILFRIPSTGSTQWFARPLRDPRQPEPVVDRDLGDEDPRSP